MANVKDSDKIIISTKALKSRLTQLFKTDIKCKINSNCIRITFNFNDISSICKLNDLMLGRVSFKYKFKILYKELKAEFSIDLLYINRLVYLITNNWDTDYGYITGDLTDECIIENFNIDIEIKRLILLFKRLGYNSKSSCSGHGSFGNIVLDRSILGLFTKSEQIRFVKESKYNVIVFKLESICELESILINVCNALDTDITDILSIKEFK